MQQVQCGYTVAQPLRGAADGVAGKRPGNGREPFREAAAREGPAGLIAL